MMKNRNARQEDVPYDEYNMKMIKQMADEIHRSIETTVDYPSRNEDKKIAILDLKVWLASAFDQETHETSVVILHEHYHKDVASRSVIDARSAIPWKAKRTILTPEILRVLRNCSRRLPWKEVCAHVETFCARMQFSGYHKTFRTQVVKSALSAYDAMVKKDEQGEEPLYRPREWRMVERAKSRRAKKGEWFRGGKQKNETVIFVPATPGGELKKRYQKLISDAKVKVAVAEVPGASIKRRLQKSDPFKEKKCKDPSECMVCSGEGKGGKCRNEGVTYEIRCKGCEGRYVGETSRNAFTRGGEHLTDLQKKNTKSPLHLHNVEEHRDATPPGFEMKVTGTFGGDATKRQVRESVLIQKVPSNDLMNRRDEWRQVKLPRVELRLS